MCPVHRVDIIFPTSILVPSQWHRISIRCVRNSCGHRNMLIILGNGYLDMFLRVGYLNWESAIEIWTLHRLLYTPLTYVFCFVYTVDDLPTV